MYRTSLLTMFGNKRCNKLSDMVTVREILDIQQKPKPPTRLLYKNSSTPNSFQDAMKSSLLLMQVFGYFPIHGITGPNYRSLKFTWLSWKVLYCSICLAGNVSSFICYCLHRRINNILAINYLFFNLGCLSMAVLFLYLAMQWPMFVKEWHLVEVAMKSYELSINLKRKLAIIVISILGLALIEHTMITMKTLMESVKKYPNSSYDVAYDYFANHTFVEIFYYFPYSVWLGLFFQILVVQKTFIWSFVDVFIILVSVCFNFRLRQISKKLNYMSKTEISDENIWRTIREDYVKVSNLCEITNKHLSWFIIISYFTNIYHILSQLFSSLRPIENSFYKIYFYVSFFLVILRVTTVCVFGGAIYDEYEHITRIMTTVPSSAYNTEVERFVTHLATCEIALSGKNFFKITRNLILKVTSAIVTYELVLIQFNQKEFKTKDT